MQGHLAFYRCGRDAYLAPLPQSCAQIERRPVVIDRPDALSRQAVDKALHEVETLLAFLHQIGGDLDHVLPG